MTHERSIRFERIYALVRTVPAGCVATYGQIAFVTELSTPRLVGKALSALPLRGASAGGTVPWHRIVNGQGRISARKEGQADSRQTELLRAEGVLLDARGRVDFHAVAWTGPTWEWLDDNGYDVGALIARSELLARRGPWVRWSV